MGTPHCGADKAKWGSVLGHLTEVVKTTNTSIVDLLVPDSEVLARIQQEFAAMLQVRQDKGLPKIEIACFFESLPYTVMFRNLFTFGAYSDSSYEDCTKAFSDFAR